MKINVQRFIGATCGCLLWACGNPPAHGGNNAIGGSQAGSSNASGGATLANGGATADSGSNAFGGSTLANGGSTVYMGGTTATAACAGNGELDSTQVDGGLTGPIVITSSQDCFWQHQYPEVSTSGDANVSVRESIEAQTWDGFGGAFTELGWLYLSRLSDADRGQAIQLLFGSSGARLAWGRVPVGGNDYVVSRHTLDDMGDDVVPDSNESNRPPADLALAKFSIDGDLNNLVPFIKAAQEVKSDIRFWAAAWTPPVWMKTGYSKLDINGAPVPRPSYYDGGSMKGDAATLQAHAQYFVKFVEAYRALGINVEMVAPQNEPAGGHTYPSCAWDASTYTSFIGKYLGPALNAAGLSTRVMLGGSLDSGADTTFVSAVLADSAAKAYCAVAGLGYDMVAASKVTALKSAGIPIWVSEHKAGNYPWNEATYKTIAPNDMAYAVETWGLIRDAINKVGVTAYSTWHMVLDRTGNNIDTASPWAQNALLVADSGHLTATPAYYVFRHLSRFVEPGAKVISTTGGDAVAFKNPNGSVVVVMYNSGTSQAITVALGSRKLHLNVPQGGFATLVDPR